MIKNENKQAKFSSKIPRINIEIPNYEYFHSPSQIENNDARFIGREQIIKRLKNILTNNSSKKGSYLITGYRGMGKSSYVNKVLNQITLKKRNWPMSVSIWFFLWLFIALLLDKNCNKFVWFSYPIIGILIILYYSIFGKLLNRTKYLFLKWKWISKIWNENISRYFKLKGKSKDEKLGLLKDLTKKIFFISKLNDIYQWLRQNPIREFINRRKRVVVNLNLGHEILDELDILSLISDNIGKEFKKFAYKFRWQFFLYLLKFAVLYFLTNLIVSPEIQKRIYSNSELKVLFPVQSLSAQKGALTEEDCVVLLQNSNQNNFNLTIYEKDSRTFKVIINTLTRKTKQAISLFDIYLYSIYGYVSNFIADNLLFSLNPFPLKINFLFLFCFFFLNFTLTFFFNFLLTSRYSKYSSRKKIIKKLKNLNDNIDAVIKTERSNDMGVSVNNSGFHIKNRKLKEYPLAGIRQIEKSLIDILDDIDNLFPLILKPEFIIVFDELDKIDPKINANIDKENDITDFDISISGFAGGASNRYRKQNVLKLLGNMKYFITTAKAKFIFISGRELYDAFLADVADREFSISSIFHEVIYVDSFLSDDSDQRKGDIVSMAEHYVCQFIMPRWYIDYQTYKLGSKYEALTLKCYKEYLNDSSDIKKNNTRYKEKVLKLVEKISKLDKKTKIDAGKKFDSSPFDFLRKNNYRIIQCNRKKMKPDNEKIKLNKEKIKLLRLNNNKFSNAVKRFEIEKIGLLESFDKVVNEQKQTGKVILLLYQFVHYLTYVSNGAPKKITNLFERHIHSNLHNPTDSYIRRTNQDIYLSFGYLDQCKIGFIHYLSHPFMMAIMNNVSLYGDKLLVSASFLIDHIYKFHNNGFSWRNLENIPETLDSSRTPELRTLINSIIGYMTQNHISTIVSGLYLFKFPKKIAEEIQFISKISEEASAIYNFSLDESLVVKRHYARLLQYYIKQYTKEKGVNGTEKTELLHSIANIHHILGDLHLQDEEYTEAIFEYQNCIQFVSHKFKNEYDPHNDSHLLFIIRNMLKLGLAFEKRKTFNSAYVTYSELTSILIDFRYIDEEQLGMGYKIEKSGDWRKYKAILLQAGKSKTKGIYRKETRPLEIRDEEKDTIQDVIIGDEFIPSLARITTPLKNKIIARLSMFEDMRLMYQALLAKLFVLEKQQLEGITLTNLDVIEGEFIYLHHATNLKDKFLISADFFKKLGDVLYYKNGLITKESSYLFNGLYFWDYDIRDDIERFPTTMRQKEILNHLRTIQFSSFQDYYNKNKEDKPNFKSLFISYINKGNGLAEFSGILNEKLENEGKKHKKVEEFKFLEEFFSEENFNPPVIKFELISKVFDCCERREYLLNKRNIAPCFACKYYNRSLYILSKHLLNKSENELTTSKSFLFLEMLDHNSQDFQSTRLNVSQTLSSVLGGIGDIVVGCSTDEDYIFPDFLDLLFKYINHNREDHIGIMEFEEIIKKRRTEPIDKETKDIELIKDDCLLKLYLIKTYRKYKKNSQSNNLTLKIDQIVSEIKTFDPENKLTNRQIDIRIKVYIDNHPKEKRKLKGLLNGEKEELIKKQLQTVHQRGLSQLEKAILYYLASAKYYKKTSNYRDSAFMYQKIVKLLIQFAESKPIYKSWITKHLDNIKNELVRRTFQNIYASYDHIHVTEIRKLKELSHKEPYELLSLSEISLFPELEDSIYTYYRLAITCNDSFLTNKMGIFKKLYELPSLSSNRLNSSIYNRLISLRFKAFLNQKIFEYIIDYKFERDTYVSLRIIRFYRKLGDSLKNKNTIWSSFFWMKQGDNTEERLAIIEMLILDSIFCLQKFIEIVYPHNETTLFTNRYVANIYKSLFEWTQLYEFILLSYYKIDEKSRKPDALKTRLKYLSNGIDVRTKIQEIFSQIPQLNESGETRARLFTKTLEELVDSSNMYIVDSNYLAEMAIKKYQRAFTMHKEGKSYKDTIEGLYYLNDDLDNDTFKFYLALERYRINTSDTSESMRKLKDVYSKSSLFDVDKYYERN
jgi:hypothetical protein